MTLNSSIEQTYVYGTMGINIWGSQIWPDIQKLEVPTTIHIFPWRIEYFGF